MIRHGVQMLTAAGAAIALATVAHAQAADTAKPKIALDIESRIETPDISLPELSSPTLSTAGDTEPVWREGLAFDGDARGGRAEWDTSLDFDAGNLVEFSTGRKWGFTLGLQRLDRDTIEYEGVSAGAFFNLTPRMRIGGAFAFTAQDEGLVPGERPEKAPEIKLESAFKF
jgi:hypothetical protein